MWCSTEGCDGLCNVCGSGVMYDIGWRCCGYSIVFNSRHREERLGWSEDAKRRGEGLGRWDRRSMFETDLPARRKRGTQKRFMSVVEEDVFVMNIRKMTRIKVVYFVISTKLKDWW